MQNPLFARRTYLRYFIFSIPAAIYFVASFSDGAVRQLLIAAIMMLAGMVIIIAEYKNDD